MDKSKNIFILGVVLFLSIIFSYIILEDTIGGAQNDFNFHKKFIILFAEDFKNTFYNYGRGELLARNSPIFYIFLSFLYKIGIEIDKLKYLNIISIPLLVYVFYSCLKIQFKNINTNLLIFLSFVVLLSPTVRSLVVWPYPILYGFIFFLLSIKFYLKFIKVKKFKINEAFKNVFFLALASYITPNFSVFAVFFLYKFFLEFKNSKYFFYIIALNCFLAIPAFLHYYINGFYLFSAPVINNINLSNQLNISNKIIIISSLIFFYFIPFINKKMFKKTIYVFKDLKKQLALIIFFIISIYFFSYPTGNFGGGIFYHLSQILLGNNIFLFFIFLLSILLFKGAKLFNLNNFLLFLCLILYNLQASIYHKYFDPLLLFIFFFLFEKIQIKNQRSFLDITKNYYILYLIFLGMSFYKVNFL